MGAAGDLEDGVVLQRAVLGLEGLGEEADQHVGVGVGGREDERLAGEVGVDVAGQLGADDAVEVLGEHALVEAVDLDVHLVLEVHEVEGVRLLIEHLHLRAGRPADAVLGELGDDACGGLVIDEAAIDDGLAVRVAEGRLAEDLDGVQGGRGGEADLHRVEMVEHAAELGDVIG